MLEDEPDARRFGHAAVVVHDHGIVAGYAQGADPPVPERGMAEASLARQAFVLPLLRVGMYGASYVSGVVGGRFAYINDNDAAVRGLVTCPAREDFGFHHIAKWRAPRRGTAAGHQEQAQCDRTHAPNSSDYVVAHHSSFSCRRDVVCGEVSPVPSV